jgi:hypothetical protein
LEGKNVSIAANVPGFAFGGEFNASIVLAADVVFKNIDFDRNKCFLKNAWYPSPH